MVLCQVFKTCNDIIKLVISSWIASKAMVPFQFGLKGKETSDELLSSEDVNPLYVLCHTVLSSHFLVFFIQMESDKKAYETGERVPETGIYRVVHSAHRLPHEVVILKDEQFPRCCKCSESVVFNLIHAAPELFWRTVYHVYELPLIDDEAAATGT